MDDLIADPSGYCFTATFNQPLGTVGFVLERTALYSADDTVLTAIAATEHLEETVIFLGDQQGNLRKVSNYIAKYIPRI